MPHNLHWVNDTTITLFNGMTIFDIRWMCDNRLHSTRHSVLDSPSGVHVSDNSLNVDSPHL